MWGRGGEYLKNQYLMNLGVCVDDGVHKTLVSSYRSVATLSMGDRKLFLDEPGKSLLKIGVPR